MGPRGGRLLGSGTRLPPPLGAFGPLLLGGGGGSHIKARRRPPREWGTLCHGHTNTCVRAQGSQTIGDSGATLGQGIQSAVPLDMGIQTER